MTDKSISKPSSKPSSAPKSSILDSDSDDSDALDFSGRDGNSFDLDDDDINELLGGKPPAKKEMDQVIKPGSIADKRKSLMAAGFLGKTDDDTRTETSGR